MKFLLNALITQLAFSGVTNASNYACDQYHSLSAHSREHLYMSDKRTRHSVAIPWSHFADDRWCMLFDTTIGDPNGGIGIDFDGTTITLKPEQSQVSNNNAVNADQLPEGSLKFTKNQDSQTYKFMQYQIDAKTGTFMIIQGTDVLYTYQDNNLKKDQIQSGGISMFFRASSKEFWVRVLDPKKFPLTYHSDIELNMLKARVAVLEKEQHSDKKIDEKIAAKTAEKEAQIKTLTGKVADHEKDFENSIDSCKKQMQAKNVVINQAWKDEITVSHEHVKLQKSDYELVEAYEALMKKYQHNMNFERDERYSSQKMSIEVEQLHMKYPHFHLKAEKPAVVVKSLQIDESSTSVSTTSAAAIAIAGLAMGATASFMVFKKKENNKNGLYFDQEEME